MFSRCALITVVLSGYQNQAPHCEDYPWCPYPETPTVLFRYFFEGKKQHSFYVNAYIILSLKTKSCTYFSEKWYMYAQHLEFNWAGGRGRLYSLWRNQENDQRGSYIMWYLQRGKVEIISQGKNPLKYKMNSILRIG